MNGKRADRSRAFLKWAGGKFALVDAIDGHLPRGERLVEPFVGAGSVFLNTEFDRYLLNDINSDLIALYNFLKRSPEQLIADARKLFTEASNHADIYYQYRLEFNGCKDKYRRALLFLYMNRHGYNGLCRYNRKGGFNVPFGRYKKPYFPEKELWFFAEKAQRAEFVCESYTDTFARCGSGDVIYCDPPYAPLSNTASFTTYASQGFTLDDQAMLARVSRDAARNGVPVLISNHDTVLTRELYHGSRLHTLQVKRTISRNTGKRNKVDELFALYLPEDAEQWQEAEPETELLPELNERDAEEGQDTAEG